VRNERPVAQSHRPSGRRFLHPTWSEAKRARTVIVWDLDDDA
jgi:hypothetical protein